VGISFYFLKPPNGNALHANSHNFMLVIGDVKPFLRMDCGNVLAVGYQRWQFLCDDIVLSRFKTNCNLGKLLLCQWHTSVYKITNNIPFLIYRKASRCQRTAKLEESACHFSRCSCTTPRHLYLIFELVQYHHQESILEVRRDLLQERGYSKDHHKTEKSGIAC